MGKVLYGFSGNEGNLDQVSDIDDGFPFETIIKGEFLTEVNENIISPNR